MQGEIEMWIDFSSASLDAPLRSWIMPLLKVLPYDESKEAEAKAAVASALEVLNTHLGESGVISYHLLAFILRKVQ